MNLNDLLAECSDGELKSLSVIFTLAQVLKDKGILNNNEINMISTIGAKIASDFIKKKKKDWEK